MKGKSEKELLPFLASLKGRERVKVVCIDLSSTYRRIIRKWFPNAKIVSDRFHVIRLIQHHFLTLFRELVPALANERGVFRLRVPSPRTCGPNKPSNSETSSTSTLP